MSLIEKSRRILELPRVLAMLADCAESAEAKDWAAGVAPETEMENAARLQEETQAAYLCMGRQGSPAFSALKPMHGIVGRAARGGVLSARELLDVAALLRIARQVKGYAGEPKRELSCLDGFFSALTPLRQLEDGIANAILSEDEIADAASPELAGIRRKMRLAASKVREVLQRLVSSRSKALQEALYTQRGGRYVVPVKSEHKNEVPGLVHDVSSSGATFFVEPMEVVNLNNEIREWESAERDEIRRILAALSADVAAAGSALNENHDVLLNLDCIFARARLAYAMHASKPALSDRGVLILRRARHPLLDVKTAVPITVSLGETFDTLIVTGPNTGGKTVALKTLGLLTLMASCGLQVPADDGSCLPVMPVLADIGDEQSIEQSLSTFSAHMTNIVAILREAAANTLVLFDELGAGTDPVEGAALAQSIVAHVRRTGAKVAATTHYAELKAYALTAEGVENAACEFDVETLRPTYRLLIGVPGKSNAFAISKRLGLSQEIIDEAGRRIDAGDAALEDVLSELESRRRDLERARDEAQSHERQTAETRLRAEKLTVDLETQRKKAAERAQAEARQILDEARAAADLAYEEIAKARRRAEKGEFNDLSQARAELKRRLNETEKSIGVQAAVIAPQEPTRPLRIGDTVEMLRLGGQGTVVSLPDKDGRIELQAGILKIKASAHELRLVQTQRVTVERHRESAPRDPAMRSAAIEFDIRGRAVDEALPEVDAYIDSAVAAKLETVRIIHGKGTGVLRAAVQKHLKTHRQVSAFRLGRYGEGEDGVTVVTLRR